MEELNILINDILQIINNIKSQDKFIKELKRYNCLVDELINANSGIPKQILERLFEISKYIEEFNRLRNEEYKLECITSFYDIEKEQLKKYNIHKTPIYINRNGDLYYLVCNDLGSNSNSKLAKMICEQTLLTPTDNPEVMLENLYYVNIYEDIVTYKYLKDNSTGYFASSMSREQIKSLHKYLNWVLKVDRFYTQYKYSYPTELLIGCSNPAILFSI